MNALFIATDLSTISGSYPTFDVTLGGKVYRRIDPEYYAWLRRKIELAKTRLDQATYQVLLTRFMEIHRQAVDEFGVSTLKNAAQTFDIQTYNPPGKQTSLYLPDYEYPTGDHPELTFTQRVYRHALEEVDRIRDEAIHAGWTEAKLYQNRGRYKLVGQDYGIICSIQPGYKLGQVTYKTIAVTTRPGNVLRFYNTDAPGWWKADKQISSKEGSHD